MRHDRNWTLSYVSERTGIPLSALSKFERDKQSISYGRLLILAELFQVELGQLFEDSNARMTPKVLGRRSIDKLSNHRKVEDSKLSDIYLATDLLEKGMTPMICETRIRRLEEYGEWSRHSGEEFLFVIEGQLLLHSEMYTPVELNEGESIYFDSEIGHAYLLGEGECCRFLSVCRP
jgi:transcriptional regulator with XRE-family HTH domain